MRYKVVLTAEQLGLISRALEVYARIGTGQINIVTETISMDFHNEFEFTDNAREELRGLSDLMRSCAERARSQDGARGSRQSSAYYLHQCIRNRLSWDLDPSGGLTVNFDEPLAMQAETRPQITTVVEADKMRHVCSLSGGYNLCGAPYPASAIDVGVITKDNITKVTCLDCRYLANPSRRRSAF